MTHRLDIYGYILIFLIFITKNANSTTVLLFNFVSVSNFEYYFYVLFENLSPTFVILAEVRYARPKYSTKNYLKHSLSLLF